MRRFEANFIASQFLLLAWFAGLVLPLPNIEIIILAVAWLFSSRLTLVYIGLDIALALRSFPVVQAMAESMLSIINKLTPSRVLTPVDFMLNPQLLTIFAFIWVLGELIIGPWFIAYFMKRLIRKKNPSIAVRLGF